MTPITWRIGEVEEGVFTLHIGDALILQRDNVYELVMYVYSASCSDQDVLQWNDTLGCSTQTLEQSKRAYIGMQQRFQEATGGHDEASHELDLYLIERRCDAAAPGPWHTEPNLEDWLIWLIQDTQANAQFVAHARTDVPALLAEVRRLLAERR